MGLEFGSVCSGIEAASVAWHPLGWRASWLAEVDKAASEVLSYRFPDTPNHGDMLLLADKVRRREIPAPDVLVGGTPCQAFSVAGRREGLSDSRGQLTLAFVDLADAIDEVRRADGKPPVVIVWENVPGVLTSKDNAFGCFLAGLAGESDELKPAGRKWTHAGVVLGPERAVAWRTLDAQYFGLAQRRRRVFVVASAREGFDPAAVLLESEGVRRDSPPSREPGQGTTSAIDACTQGRSKPSHWDGDYPHPTLNQSFNTGAIGYSNQELFSQRGAGLVDGRLRQPAGGVKWPADIASTLNAHYGSKWGLEDQHVNQGCPLFVPEALAFQQNSRDEIRLMGGDGGIAGSLCAEPGTRGTTTLVATTIGFSSKDYGQDAGTEISPTLRAGTHTESHANGGCAPAVAYAIQERAVCENPLAGPDGMGVRDDDCAYTMEARQVPQAVAYSFKPSHFTRGKDRAPSEVYPPLTADADKGDQDPVIAYMPARTFGADGGIDERFAERDICDALHTSSGHGNKAPLMVEAYRVPGNVTPYSTGDRVDALTSANDSSAQFPILQEMAVRRLLPIECERLQGFPTVITLKVEEMTRDEVIIAALINKDIIVDAEAGKVYGTRGPGGIPLGSPRELGCRHPSGYMVANLTANGVKKQVRLHRVVWMSRHGLIPDGYVPDHINNDKADNRISNLQLLTGADNSSKAHAEGRIDYDASGATKLTAEVRAKLFHDYASGGGSYRDMAEKYGVCKSRVGQIIEEHGWTAVPTGKKGKPAADGPRYKQLGNSMAVNVMAWLGQRIAAHLESLQDDDFDSLIGGDEFDALLA